MLERGDLAEAEPDLGGSANPLVDEVFVVLLALDDGAQFVAHRLRLRDDLRDALVVLAAEGEFVAVLEQLLHVFEFDFLVARLREELREPLVAHEAAPFVIAMDPLDGSSNIVSNNAFGSIVGVYREDLPQKGRKLVAAFYKLYGPVNTFVYTVGKGTHEFVKHYDSEGKAQFLLLADNLKIPEPGEVFGLGGDPLNRYFGRRAIRFCQMAPTVERTR